MRLANLDDVEHRPLDDELAAAFSSLLDATHAFLNFYALNSFSERIHRDEDWRNVGWSGGEAEGLDGEHRRMWNERARGLEARADDVGEAYDNFIDLARRKLLLNTAE